MWLKKIHLYLLQIQLCMPVKHYLAEHTFSENLLVKVVTDSGVVGYGEGVARNYVTGETIPTSLNFLRKHLIPQINGFHADEPESLLHALARLITESDRARSPASCCALELAILDAAGKTWETSVAELLGGEPQPLVYSAVVPMMAQPSFHRLLHLIHDQKMSIVKIKVGNDKDQDVLSAVREILGPEADLRVDANGAWSSEDAKTRVEAMMDYGISAVEQPVARDDIKGLKQLTERLPIPVIADESLCVDNDAKVLATLGACQVFNLRLSKCGGILAAVRMYEIGSRYGIAAQLGCHVGETGLLSAAGRQFAMSRKLRYLEGSYSAYLLKEDIVNEPVNFGEGGVAPPLVGHGLGVSVNEEALERLAVMHEVIELGK